VLPHRWVVERFFAWINRNRRLAKDFEATIASATAFLYTVRAMLAIDPVVGSFRTNFESDSWTRVIAAKSSWPGLTQSSIAAPC
jgi:hypothetical protein